MLHASLCLNGCLIFVLYYGLSLDEMTPLLCADPALNKQVSRLLKHIGLQMKGGGIVSNIGLKPEFLPCSL